MSIITSPEMFINMKRIPDITSKEYVPFFKEELKKIKKGITINGVRIPGWLYWHINHWIIDIDIEDEAGLYIERDTRKPDLRDNEWLIGEYMDKAEIERRGLLILGSRQLGKSEFGASYMGRRAICFKNTQNIIAGLSDPDLKMLTSKIDRGFVNLHPFFKPARIEDNWNRQVTLGYKDAQGQRYKFSEILIRNLSGGNNTENLAGPTTSSLLLDEIGKDDFLEAFIAARPALETKFGWRCSPIFTGTSGSFEKSKDLETFYGKLETFNFLCVELKDKDGKKKFIPGHHASRADRKKIRLSTFLGKAKGSELDIIPIHVVRDEEKENQKILTQIEEYDKAGQHVLALKEQMYYPITEDDLFLSSDEANPFADIKELAKEHLKYLESIEPDEEYGWMERDSETGKPKFINAPRNKKPIQTFPTNENEDKDAPIFIYDHPLEGGEFGILHIAGADPYNQDESYYSPSLGALYIYRRTYDPLNGRFQESIVAGYVARTRNVTRWQEQVRLLLEYYGATCLPENEERSFIQYFDTRNIIYYLEDGLDLAKEINPGTKVKRRKGLAATTPNQRFGNGLIVNYCLEDIVVGQTPDGEPIIKKGIVRIKDKLLLKEIIEYKPGLNVDRIVAFRHALILNTAKSKFHPVAKVEKPQTERPKRLGAAKSPFLHQLPGGAFGRRRGGPFRTVR